MSTDPSMPQKELRQTEEEFRALADAIPQMVAIANADGWTYWYNQRWYDYTGTTPEEMQGWGWQSVIDPAALPEITERWKACLESGEPFEMTFSIRDAAGKFKPFLTRAVPVRDANGKITRWFGTNTDVSSQMQIEQELREHQERLSLAQQTAHIGTFEFNLETNENRWTPELEAIYGLAPGTFAGTMGSWTEMLHPDDKARVIRQVEASLQTRAPGRADWRVIWPDRSIHWVMGTWQVLRDGSGRPTRLIGTNIDVTERKEAELAGRQLAAIVESSDDAIVSKDLNGVVMSWNRSAENLFGYRAEEIIGRSILVIIPPELHHDEPIILSKIRRGEKIDHFETIRLKKNGERVEVSLTISPVKDAQGNVIGAAKIVRDITENKRIEHALRTTEKLAAAGRLAATVAHEINNPLEAVTNLVYLARRDMADRAKVEKYLELASRELDRVAHIARQTLGFYRDTSSPSRFRVGQTLDQLLFLYEKRLEARGIEIRKQYSDNLEIVALAGEIRQAFSNLIGNAIDAMPSGGSLVIRVSSSHEWKNGLPGLRVTIVDSGSGIAPRHRRELFQPFFTTKKDVGTGLGLWITRNIIEKHHGTIRVKSSTGASRHGTAFSIFLPSGNVADSLGREGELATANAIVA